MLSKSYFLEGQDKQEVQTFVGSAEVMSIVARQDLSEVVALFTQKSKQDVGEIHEDTWGKGILGKRHFGL